MIDESKFATCHRLDDMQDLEIPEWTPVLTTVASYWGGAYVSLVVTFKDHPTDEITLESRICNHSEASRNANAYTEEEKEKWKPFAEKVAVHLIPAMHEAYRRTVQLPHKEAEYYARQMQGAAPPASCYQRTLNETDLVKIGRAWGAVMGEAYVFEKEIAEDLHY